MLPPVTVGFQQTAVDQLGQQKRPESLFYLGIPANLGRLWIM